MAKANKHEVGMNCLHQCVFTVVMQNVFTSKDVNETQMCPSLTRDQNLLYFLSNQMTYHTFLVVTIFLNFVWV